VQIQDRSRHGTLLNGEPVQQAALSHGDRLTIGGFEVELVLSAAGQEARPTVQPERDASHEQLLGADQDCLGVVRLSLNVEHGPAKGRSFPLPAVDVTVGSEPSQLVVPEAGLLPRHLRLLVNRGRVIVQPEAGAVTVDRERVRGLFPLLTGEAFEAGRCLFRLVRVDNDERPEAQSFGAMIGCSHAMRRVFGLLRRMAAHPVPVLLQGESGTGKELAARGLHDSSPSRAGRFVAVNCAAITESLFESELFGHEKGAFTGAANQRDGAFHAADGGTLFLDEVGEIPVGLQAKLLRALESGEVRRVGSNLPTYPDVRVVAATNRDLAADVNEGLFREDLYFRMAVLNVRLPPLREHPDDIPGLCAALGRSMKVPLQVTNDAMDLLQAHFWPGNVRELRNVLTRAYVLHGPVVKPHGLTFSSGLPGIDLPPDDNRSAEARETERAMCLAALARHRGNRAAAARELGLPRTTFLYKLRRLGMER